MRAAVLGSMLLAEECVLADIAQQVPRRFPCRVTGIDLSSGFPTSIPSVYTNLQGEVDVTSQIMLGGKGMKANGEPQLTNSDSYKVNADGSITDSAKVTFEVRAPARHTHAL